MEKILLVTSEGEPASRNMLKILKENYGLGELAKKGIDVTVGDDLPRLALDSCQLDLSEYDIAVFLSWHRSKSGFPALTSHACGNFSTAEMGGNSKELAYTSARMIGTILRNLNELSGKSLREKFQIVQETTHHGPTGYNIPLVFAEVGSSEAEWNNMEACSTVVEAVLKSLNQPTGKENVIAFGGPHYAERFTKRIIAEEKNFGHIAANYALEAVDEGLVRQMIDKTIEDIDYAILQKKMRSDLRAKITGILDSLGMEWVRV